MGAVHIYHAINTDCFLNDYFIVRFKGRNTSSMARLDVTMVANFPSAFLIFFMFEIDFLTGNGTM